MLVSLTLYILSSFQALHSEGCVAILKLNLALSFIVYVLLDIVSLSGTVDMFPFGKPVFYLNSPKLTNLHWQELFQLSFLTQL